MTAVYDNRCALCGIRIVTPDGQTVVESAHIVPWSRSQNDDIRNGMAALYVIKAGVCKITLSI